MDGGRGGRMGTRTIPSDRSYNTCKVQLQTNRPHHQVEFITPPQQENERDEAENANKQRHATTQKGLVSSRKNPEHFGVVQASGKSE